MNCFPVLSQFLSLVLHGRQPAAAVFFPLQARCVGGRGVWAGRRSEGRAVVRGIHRSYFIAATYSADAALLAHFNRLVLTLLHRQDCVCWLFDFEKRRMESTEQCEVAVECDENTCVVPAVRTPFCIDSKSTGVTSSWSNSRASWRPCRCGFFWHRLLHVFCFDTTP